jgi:hypothetical protein
VRSTWLTTTGWGKVAIKFLPAEVATDERSRQRLLGEAKAACILDHPNICAIDEAISVILTVDRRPRTDDR